jgi:hypothetical protein
MEGTKLVKARNENITAMNYEKLFAVPSEQRLAELEVEFAEGVSHHTYDDRQGGGGGGEEEYDGSRAGSSSDVDTAWDAESEIEAGAEYAGESPLLTHDFTNYGAAADGGESAYADALGEAMTTLLEEDPNTYPTWQAVEERISAYQDTHRAPPLPPPPAANKAAVKVAAPAPVFSAKKAAVKVAHGVQTKVATPAPAAVKFAIKRAAVKVAAEPRPPSAGRDAFL